MPVSSPLFIDRGLRPGEETAAADLFWQAFSGKLGRVLGPDDRALAYLSRALYPPNALCARTDAGELIGLAGIKSRAGGLLGGDFWTLAAVYGRVGAAWRGLLLEQMDRPLAEGQISLDGLCVAATSRGAGVGAALLEATQEHARDMGARELWLEVVDTNPRARAFYAKSGFETAGHQNLGLLRHVFGFRTAEAMVLRL